jgi:hypothetical protein
LNLSHRKATVNFSPSLEKITKSPKRIYNFNKELDSFSLRPTAVKLIDLPVHPQKPNKVSRFQRLPPSPSRINARPKYLFQANRTDSISSLANKMKHLAAYLLLSLGGNSSPSEKDIKTVLESVGIEADDERLSTLISELKGKDLQEVCDYTI